MVTASIRLGLRLLPWLVYRTSLVDCGFWLYRTAISGEADNHHATTGEGCQCLVRLLGVEDGPLRPLQLVWGQVLKDALGQPDFA